MTEKILEIKDLHMIYKTDESDVYALNGIDLTIHRGETLGMIGESGAGKTSIALSIMQLLPEKVGFITGGSIQFEGTELTTAGEQAMQNIRGKDISMIFADPMTTLNPLHRAGDQVREVLKLHNVTASKEELTVQTKAILSKVGIHPERMDEFPHQFSGGMRQRIVIAMALACNPKLLIADEATTALDVTIQAQILNMVNKLKEEMDTATLLITHDFGIVAQMCNSVAVIYSGEIIEYGSIQHIFKGDKHHPYTIGLFNSMPSMVKDEARLHPIKGMMPDPTLNYPGCGFADRCPDCREICRTTPPPALKVDEHMIRCHLFAPKGGVQA